MRNQLLAFVLLLALSSSAIAQKTTPRFAKVSVGFYNLENLFDTIDGPNNDADFLPQGANQWTNERYMLKLDNMAEAVSQIAAGRAPDILGLCELENRTVLEDLIAHPKLATVGYDIVHFDSPDRRGIDVALIYRPEIYRVTNSSTHRVIVPNEPEVLTRDVLQVNGTILGEPVSVLVAHWPSRSGGEQISLGRRMAAAKLMRHLTDSIQSASPSEKIILLGDFNDDPTSPSLTDGLKAHNTLDRLGKNDLFNVMARLHKQGYGTLAYRDVWNLFDNIVVSSNLITEEQNHLHALLDPSTKAYGRIFNASFLTQKTGQYKGYPFRTFSFGQFQNGYSDHYPVYMYLVKRL